MTTDTSFDTPAAAGYVITVKCPDGFINQGSETITCQNEIHYKYDTEPRCEPQPDQGIISCLSVLTNSIKRAKSLLKL